MSNDEDTREPFEFPHDQVIDSRDLFDLLEGLRDNVNDGPNDLDDSERQLLDDLTDAANAEDWEYGAGFIDDVHFEDYARELAEDIGAIPSDVAWPCTCIDWERAAWELRMDYTSHVIDGRTYWCR